MTLVASLIATLVAAVLSSIFAFAAGRVTAGSRYRSQLSALNEKHRHSLDGLAAVSLNFCHPKIDLEPIHRASVRAAHHLLKVADFCAARGGEEDATGYRSASAELGLSGTLTVLWTLSSWRQPSGETAATTRRPLPGRRAVVSPMLGSRLTATESVSQRRAVPVPLVKRPETGYNIWSDKRKGYHDQMKRKVRRG